ncbi:MAG: PstS family phosphate ABC transporter substrate-binding protein [Chloroflexi bacterium]|nr:PstS family phosphate ABC transporter substrate-binding protein [Chloroflexota bacterium]
MWGVLAAMLVALALVAAGCSGADEETPSPTSPPAASQPTPSSPSTQPTTPPQTSQLRGTIEIDGSSTVFPVTEAVAEEFRKVHPNVQVNVGVSGTGGGFKRFTTGETQISDASRPIKDSEAQAAAANGIEYIELRVAIDGLSVLVNTRNDFVDCLTVAELKKIWEPGSTISSWNQVRAGFPSDPLRLYGPGTDSGTFDYFTEEIVGEAQASRSDYVASEDDNVLVQGIDGDRNALGYFGYAYYVQNPDKLKAVAVDGGSGCVTPTDATIASGQYSPLSRPIFIYVNKDALERPEVKAFVEFYMENGGELSAEVGYIALASSIYQENLAMVRGETASSSQPPATQQLRGTIEIDGSSTVFPVTEAVAEEFRKVHPNVQVNVGVSGTGGGFKRFTEGETQISDASRPIKDSEAQAAAANGIEYIELRVAIDGLSVLVNPQNDFAQCMTVEQLKAIWEPGSTIDSWDDINPAWPANPLRLYGPGTDSGTFDYFTEEIVGEAQASRADYVASEDDNVLVQGIGGDRNALGYFGYAYYVQNPDKLKAVAIDGGSGCVTPTDATIASGEYTPLSRPIFIYVNKDALERPEVKAFVDFYMESGGALSAEVGYIPLAAAIYQENKMMVQQ